MKKSRARLTIDFVGPTEAVGEALHLAIAAAKYGHGVETSFPEPLRIEPIVRERKKKVVMP